MRSQRTACKDGGGRLKPMPRGDPTSFVRGLNQEMGEKNQDLRRTPPTTQDEAYGRGEELRDWAGQETEGEHLPQSGGGGVTEE